MNLLIIDPADFLGGAELYTVDLIKELSLKGYTIVLATNGHPDYIRKIHEEIGDKINQSLFIEKINLKRLKRVQLCSLVNLIRALKNIRHLVKKYDIDLIQTNSVRAHICGALVCRKNKKPLIWMIHDFTFPRFFARLLSRYARMIVTCSQAVKADMQSKIPPKCWPKLQVLENGIDLKKISSEKGQTDLRSNLNLRPDTILIGHVGRIDSWKGQEYLIRASQLITASLPRAHIVFVGDASAYEHKTLEYKQKLHNLIRELNLSSKISLLGYQPDAISLIKQFNLLVHTSIEPEPFGRVIIEAMASHVPVIASSCGGGPTEIVTHGENGLILDPHDYKTLASEIIKLLESPERIQKLTQNATKTIAEKFDLPKIVKKLAQIHHSILGSLENMG